jgi:hypothetical protein
MSATVSKSPFGRNLTSIIALALLAGLSIPAAHAEAGSLRARGETAQLGFKSNGGGTLPDFQVRLRDDACLRRRFHRQMQKGRRHPVGNVAVWRQELLDAGRLVREEVKSGCQNETGRKPQAAVRFDFYDRDLIR